MKEQSDNTGFRDGYEGTLNTSVLSHFAGSLCDRSWFVRLLSETPVSDCCFFFFCFSSKIVRACATKTVVACPLTSGVDQEDVPSERRYALFDADQVPVSS